MSRSRMKKRRQESGFAMLLVFVLAASIAITLFIEVPRIAFESQRTREQMTIDHALQYQRAIQLFYRKYQTYPQTLDDLETTRNLRFLRRRYLDPLTGKEFRLLHVGPAGQLTDSLVQPPAPLPGSSTGSGPNSAQGSSQTSGSSQTAGSSQSSNSSQPVDPNNPNDPNAQPPDPLNMALRRPSDRIIGGNGGSGGNGGGVNGVTGGEPVAEPVTPDPNQPQQPAQPVPEPLPGLPVQQPADPNQPLQPGQLPQDPSQPQNPGQPVIPGQPAAPQDPAQAPQPPQPPVQFPPGLMSPSGANPGQTPGTPTPFPQTPGFQQPGSGGPSFGPGGVPG